VILPVSDQVKNGAKTWLLNLSTGLTLFLGGWLLTMSDRVSKTEVYSQRIEGLESGRTTPMSKETRSELESIRREVLSVRERITTEVSSISERIAFSNSTLRNEISGMSDRIGAMHKSHVDMMQKLIEQVKTNRPPC
jgi:phage host-nuclease inhibitor protein Gam